MAEKAYSNTHVHTDMQSKDAHQPLMDKTTTIQGYQAMSRNSKGGSSVSTQVVHRSFFNSSSTISKCKKMAEYSCKVSPFFMGMTVGGIALFLIQTFDKELGLSHTQSELISVTIFFVCAIIGLLLTRLALGGPLIPKECCSDNYSPV